MKRNTYPSSQMRQRIVLIQTATIVSFLLVWESAARSGLFFKGVIPTTFEVVVAIVEEVIDPSFYSDLGATMLAATIGFAVGSLIAIALGILLGLRQFARRTIEPFIVAIGGTPKIIFLPILFLIFGLGIESKIAKAALSTFFPVVLSTTSGFIQIPKIFLQVGRSFQLNRWQMIGKIYVPAMANPLLTGLRLGMAMSILGVLAAEIAYSNAGLGFRLIRDSDQFKMASVYALAILIFALAAIINFALTKLQKYFTRHQKGSRIGEKRPMGTAPLTQE